CHALFDSLPDTPPERSEPAPAISRRELQCLKLTAEGLTSEEIALRLGLSVHTANQYLANATEKLDAANRVHAVATALRAGLIDCVPPRSLARPCGCALPRVPVPERPSSPRDRRTVYRRRRSSLRRRPGQHSAKA